MLVAERIALDETLPSRWAEKKRRVRETRPLALSAVRRLKRLLQGVNAGAKVNVKRRPIHHQSRNRLDPGCHRFFHPRFVRAEMDAFHGIFRRIKGVGIKRLGSARHE